MCRVHILPRSSEHTAAELQYIHYSYTTVTAQSLHCGTSCLFEENYKFRTLFARPLQCKINYARQHKTKLQNYSNTVKPKSDCSIHVAYLLVRPSVCGSQQQTIELSREQLSGLQSALQW